MRRTAVACMLTAALAACSTLTVPVPADRDGPVAVAELAATRGSTVTGTAKFVQRGNTVAVAVTVEGLPPNSEHGFHIHAVGDCSSGDGMSAGGHFNPDAHPHGPQTGPHHAGDMPSLKADAYGDATALFVLEGVTVSAGAHSVVGKGLIVHQDPDDYTTQPTGNAGARLACGVIAAS